MGSEIAKIEEKISKLEKRIQRLEKLVGKKSKLTNSRKKSIADVIMELKEEGFFTQRRSISEIAEKIKAKGRNVKLTSLPAYLLKLVQNNQLKRERLNEGKKRVWVYFA
jgi:predicted transcriptional regulator YheO